MAYAIWFDFFKHEEVAKAEFNNLKPNVLEAAPACLSRWDSEWHYGEMEDECYFSVTLHPWWKKALEAWNEHFQNVKIEIVDDYENWKCYDENKGYLYFTSKEGNENEDRTQWKVDYLPLLRVRFAEGYKEISRFFIGYIAEVYMRLHATNERFVIKDPEKDYLDASIEANNRNAGDIHAISTQISKDDLLFLDRIEDCNILFERVNGNYVSCRWNENSMGLRKRVWASGVLNAVKEFRKDPNYLLIEKKVSPV